METEATEPVTMVFDSAAGRTRVQVPARFRQVEEWTASPEYRAMHAQFDRERAVVQQANQAIREAADRDLVARLADPSLQEPDRQRAAARQVMHMRLQTEQQQQEKAAVEAAVERVRADFAAKYAAMGKADR